MLQELLDETNILLKTNDYENTYNIIKEKFNIEDIELIFSLLNIDVSTNIQKENRLNGFRQNVIDRYHNCIITGCKDISRCDVCHIKPFNECTFKQKYDVNNGLVLRKDLHPLFDNYKMSINPYEKTIEVLNVDDDDITKYNNKVVNIFDESLEYVKLHYEKFLIINKQNSTK